MCPKENTTDIINMETHGLSLWVKYERSAPLNTISSTVAATKNKLNSSRTLRKSVCLIIASFWTTRPILIPIILSGYKTTQSQQMMLIGCQSYDHQTALSFLVSRIFHWRKLLSIQVLQNLSTRMQL